MIPKFPAINPVKISIIVTEIPNLSEIKLETKIKIPKIKGKISALI